MIPTRGVPLLAVLAFGCDSKWNFEDGDGDGISAAEGDCWDSNQGPDGTDLRGSDIFPGAVETWYDGIDQNCNGDDDYDADGDGFIQNIHVGLGTIGNDESGFLSPGDCWDEPVGPFDGSIGGERIHPDATDIWYDGIDQDCAGNDDHDADGDGFARLPYVETVPALPEDAVGVARDDDGEVIEDCSDAPEGEITVAGEFVLGAVIYPGAEDRWYDGVDQDCAGDDDFDQDGDGYASSHHADLNGDFGADCLDGLADQELPVEDSFQWGIDGAELSKDEVLDHYGLTPADFNPDAEDVFYDGFDLNCDMANDCDQDGDGWAATGPDAPACGDEPTAPLCSIVACDNLDCNDANPDIMPMDGVLEIFYNGIDDNCNLEDADGDADGDGFWASDYATLAPDSPLEPPLGSEGDCNDADPEMGPGMYDEPYDGLDADCMGDDDFDLDRDGYAAEGYEGIPTEHSLEGGALLGTGLLPGGDCRDLDPLANPGVNEECGTTYDDDCDGDENDEGAGDCEDFHADRDGDRFGTPADARCYCDVRGSYTSTPEDALDCDDDSSVTHPGAAFAEPDGLTVCTKDADGDGYGDDASDGPFVQGTDCDDGNDAAHPAADEDCSTDFDDDCDTNTNDEDAVGSVAFYADRDEDGFGDPTDSRQYCVAEGVYAVNDFGDCDDGSDVTKPGVAIYESDASACMRDSDGDGFGDVEVDAPIEAGTDCDDATALVNPSVVEDCSTAEDDDCDVETNEVDADNCIDFYADRDGDGFGDPSDVQCMCSETDAYTARVDMANDCDDSSPTTFPGAAFEDSPDLCMKDDDGDGYGDITVSEGVVAGTDCDDTPGMGAAVNPAATEDCGTAYDDNCDGSTNEEDAIACFEHFADVDGDGFGKPTDSRCYCDAKDIYIAVAGDCDDTRNYTFPGAAENEAPEETEDGLTVLVCHKDQDEDGYGDQSPPDGVAAGTDCDDVNAAANPDPDTNEDCSTEFDDDCDGDTNDENADESLTFYADRDADGFGDPEDSRQYCVASGVYNELNPADCDDGSPTTKPGVATNELDPSLCMKDDDGDGYGDSSTGGVFVAGTDCNDVRSAVNPSVNEDCGTTYDDDCDGDTNDESAEDSQVFYADRDEDGFGDPEDSKEYCVARGVHNASNADDCDDESATTKPGVATNELDPSVCMKDDDGDGYGDSSTGGVFVAGTDCNDARIAVNPSVNEDCSTTYDDDCNGNTNDENADSCSDFFADVDGDGFGTGAPKCMCANEDIYVGLSGDCDDTRNYTFPGSAENESSMECHKDEDGDGYGDASPPAGVTAGTDCDDANLVVNPDPDTDEECGTAYDDNCDGDTNDLDASGCSLLYADTDADGYGGGDGQCRCVATDTHWYTIPADCDPNDPYTFPGAAEAESTSSCRRDADGDGYGDSSVSWAEDGIHSGSDCNDDNAEQNPGEAEVCSGDGIDENCNTEVDEQDAVGCLTFYKDGDGDSFGDPNDSKCLCGETDEWNQSNSDDCDDGDPNIKPGAPEDCDDVDSNCNGSLVDGDTNTDGDLQPDCIDADDDNDGVPDDLDCGRTDNSMYPAFGVEEGAEEECDLIDSDCDGDLVDGFENIDDDDTPDCVDDDDEDGVTIETDCDDDDPDIFPGNVDDATFSGVDNDCDGLIDEEYVFDRLDDGEDVLVFSELQVNPQGGALVEPNTEWFELTNATDETLYLDNWVFEMEDVECVADPTKCDIFTVFPGSEVAVDAGKAVLFCRDADTMDPILAAIGESCDYSYGSKPSGAESSDYHDGGYRLKNQSFSRLSLAFDGEEVDFMDHRDTVPPWPSAADAFEGLSFNLDGSLFDTSDNLTDLNDDGANWCHTTNPGYIYDPDVDGVGQHNYGTPGLVNPSCTLADP